MAASSRSRSRLIVGLLVMTLGMSGLLAYEALQAARSHRETTQGVLRDYAAFASWELSRQSPQPLLDRMTHGINAVRDAQRRGRLESITNTRVGCSPGCAHPLELQNTFAVSFPERRVTWGRTPDAMTAGALDQIIDRGLAVPDAFTCPSFEVVSDGKQVTSIVWRPFLDRRGNLTEVVGFVAPTAFISRAIAHIVAHEALLPPSLLEAGQHPNELLSVRIAAPSGETLYASSDEWSEFAAMTRLPDAYGRLEVAVALKPDAAGTLVIGGLPRERLPLIVGLLALTSSLMVVAMVQMRREAEIARMRADFVSGVSHELRTPLAQIRMFTETLLLGRVRSDAERRRSLEIVSREAQRLAQLVENLLLFSRGERKTPVITREATELAPLVGEVADSFAPIAAARQATLRMDLEAGLAARVDAGAIRQVVLNLLDNAVKYGPAGGTVEVSLRLDGNRAILTVQDEGPGIAAADRARVWEPFQRAAGPGTATGGTGIGLAIVRQLVELHGGAARVTTGPVGARFIVELPDAWQNVPAPATVA